MFNLIIVKHFTTHRTILQLSTHISTFNQQRKRKKYKGSSPIWNYAKIEKKTDGCEYLTCNQCDQAFRYLGVSTSNILNHLKTDHQINLNNETEDENDEVGNQTY